MTAPADLTATFERDLAEAWCGAAHPGAPHPGLHLRRNPDHADPRLRVAACFVCQRIAALVASALAAAVAEGGGDLAARFGLSVVNGRPQSERDGPCTCDYNPATTEGPVEDCPFHGRAYSEWIERGDALAARLAEVEAERDRVVAADEARGEWVRGVVDSCLRNERLARTRERALRDAVTALSDEWRSEAKLAVRIERGFAADRLRALLATDAQPGPAVAEGESDRGFWDGVDGMGGKMSGPHADLAANRLLAAADYSRRLTNLLTPLQRPEADEREVLAQLLWTAQHGQPPIEKWDDVPPRRQTPQRDLADAVLAAGYSRRGTGDQR